MLRGLNVVVRATYRGFLVCRKGRLELRWTQDHFVLLFHYLISFSGFHSVKKQKFPSVRWHTKEPAMMFQSLTKSLVLNSYRNLRSTRYSSLNFVYPRFKSQLEGGKSFAVNTSQLWNALPKRCENVFWPTRGYCRILITQAVRPGFKFRLSVFFSGSVTNRSLVSKVHASPVHA